LGILDDERALALVKVRSDRTAAGKRRIKKRLVAAVVGSDNGSVEVEAARISFHVFFKHVGHFCGKRVDVKSNARAGGSFVDDFRLGGSVLCNFFGLVAAFGGGGRLRGAGRLFGGGLTCRRGDRGGFLLTGRKDCKREENCQE